MCEKKRWRQHTDEDHTTDPSLTNPSAKPSDLFTVRSCLCNVLVPLPDKFVLEVREPLGKEDRVMSWFEWANDKHTPPSRALLQ